MQPCFSVENNPIGVFDSGVGGLSVLRHIRRRLPHEDLLYVADSGYAPYGGHPPEIIRQRSMALAAFLLERQCKAMVVACNTATAAAVPLLRATHDVPILAMEPAVKPAAAATRSGIIGIMATVGTLQSARFAALLERFANGIQAITQPCPGLVEQVERGELATDTTRRLVESFLRPLLDKGCDTIVLGCTHFPFLRPLIEEMAGTRIAVIDTGEAVARQLHHRLEEPALLRTRGQGHERFWTSGDVQQARRVISALWGKPCEVQQVNV